jgi:pimeloyl-ACP methyl ester carboxylesterase
VTAAGLDGQGRPPGFERVEIPVGEEVFDALASGPADGELVLLLHGFPQSSWQWRWQLAALGEAGYRAVAPDQRGYSPRARPQEVERYRVDHLAADALAVADWLGGHRFHVVGHDFGAVVAWHVAGRYPDRLRSLTAVSVPHPAAVAEALASPTGDQLARSSYIAFFGTRDLPERLMLADEGAGLRALFANTAYSDPETMERYVARLSEPGALTAALNWYRALEPAVVLSLEPVTTPTLFVWSTEEPAIGREAAEACAAHVAGPYRFEVLEGVSHWVTEDAPEELNRLLLDHLADARSA